MLSMETLRRKTRKSRKELDELITEALDVSQPAVHYWWHDGIPPKRQIELVEMFGLDPKLLLQTKRRKQNDEFL